MTEMAKSSDDGRSECAKKNCCGLHRKPGEYIERHRRYVAPTTVSPIYSAVFEKAEGVCLWDLEGNKYLDFTSQVGVLNTGHRHPRVREWVDKTREKLSFIISNDFLYCTEITLSKENFGHEIKEVSLAKLGEEIERITPGKWNKKIFPDVSGAAANIAAIELIKAISGNVAFEIMLGVMDEWQKGVLGGASVSLDRSLQMARLLKPKRNIIIGFEEAFHGRKGWSKALTSRLTRPIIKRGFTTTLDARHVPFPSCFEPRPYNFAEIVANCAGRPKPEEILAVVFEPIQGEGGINVPKKEGMESIQRYCRENDILLIADEVQTGFGRTGKFFACEHFGIEPDIMALAKGVASGEVLSLTVYPVDKLFGEYEEQILKLGWHSGTYPGGPVPCAAALGTIEVIEKEKLVENAAAMGEVLEKGLFSVYSGERFRYANKIRGLGLMRAVDFVYEKSSRPWPELRNKVIGECLKRGLLVLGCGVSAIRFLPPLIIKKEEIEKAMNIFGEAIDAALSQMKKK